MTALVIADIWLMDPGDRAPQQARVQMVGFGALSAAKTVGRAAEEISRQSAMREDQLSFMMTLLNQK